MRKLIIASLVAAALAPAVASAQPAGGFREDRRDYYRERHDERRDLREVRREDRGDWRDYRRAHPEVYRGPDYAGPRGYSYRAIAPGYRFERSYYDRRYWIDPYRYRLPAGGRFERWVRYGRDVALVDIRTGRVLRVIPGFF